MRRKKWACKFLHFRCFIKARPSWVPIAVTVPCYSTWSIHGKIRDDPLDATNNVTERLVSLMLKIRTKTMWGLKSKEKSYELKEKKEMTFKKQCQQ